jgi:hypothetical protein
VMMLGTDGIWEMVNSSNEYFGKDRLRAVIRSAAQGSAEEIATAIRTALTNFRGSAAQRDDLTFVVLKVQAVGVAPEMVAPQRLPTSLQLTPVVPQDEVALRG